MSEPHADPSLEQSGVAAAPSERHRDSCNVCGQRLDAAPPGRLARFPCHVRAFAGEYFDVWRCSACGTIHCLQRVDLDRYYSRYPFTRATLTRPFRLFYGNLLRRFLRHGLNRESRLLDYGCGNGLFVELLRTKGFRRTVGFDPYGPADGLGNPDAMAGEAFDFILLQDVVEHVEDPAALLREMDHRLAPGGKILVGTPNAERIDLARPDVFRNEVHVPYHLHIYTRETLEAMGRRLGWTPAAFYDRSYHDLPWFGLNTRAAKCYQSLNDGTQDAFFDPFQLGKALRSPRFWFYGVFGYWLSYRSDMSILFAKP